MQASCLLQLSAVKTGLELRGTDDTLKMVVAGYSFQEGGLTSQH